MTDRLSALEAQAASLAAEIAKLRAECPAPPPQPPRGEVRIVPVLDERSDLPNLKEMQKLYSAVKHLAPWPSALVDRFDENRPFRAFASAFRWAANMRRTPQPDSKRALSFWADCCRLWLRERNCVASDLDANALVLAILAQGDVAYVAADPNRGWVWELGLHGHVGRKASDAWRNVMSTGNVLPPSSPARRFAPPSPARVFVGGY